MKKLLTTLTILLPLSLSFNGVSNTHHDNDQHLTNIMVALCNEEPKPLRVLLKDAVNTIDCDKYYK